MKQKSCLFIASIFLVSLCMAQTLGGVGIGVANPDASAVLEMQSTTKGVLVPRMNSTQRNAISNAATGLLVFDNTTGSFWFKSSSNWIELVDTLNNAWKKTGNNIYAPSNFNVGLGITNPANRLSIDGNISLHNGTATFGLIRRFNTIDLNINAASGNTLAGAPAGHLSFQVPGGLLSPAGFVGIGTSTPTAKLDVNGNINTSGKITREATGTANLVPICYGRVNQFGVKVGGTDNFSVLRDFPNEDAYHIFISDMDVNPETDIIIITAHGATATVYVTPISTQPQADFRIVSDPSASGYLGFSFIVYRL